jgi:hypothetical protein
MSADALYNDDCQRDPFALLSIVEGEGVVITQSGRFTIDEAAQILVTHLERFDWQRWNERELLDERAFYEVCDAFDDLFSILSLVAQINLYQARLLWCLNAPESVGLLRMIDKATEKRELDYQAHLASLRALQGDSVTEYILSYGAEIFEWEQLRHQFVDRTAEYVARLAKAA